MSSNCLKSEGMGAKPSPISGLASIDMLTESVIGG